MLDNGISKEIGPRIFHLPYTACCVAATTGVAYFSVMPAKIGISACHTRYIRHTFKCVCAGVQKHTIISNKTVFTKHFSVCIQKLKLHFYISPLIFIHHRCDMYYFSVVWIGFLINAALQLPFLRMDAFSLRPKCFAESSKPARVLQRSILKCLVLTCCFNVHA